MGQKSRVLRAAFPYTVPVLTGYAFLGIAYGILMSSKGYGPEWSVPMSILAFAGSAQYLAVGLLSTVFDPLYALLLSSMVNARHLFYGLSMLAKFKDMGWAKYYLIFGLTDETFSIIHGIEPPSGIRRRDFILCITLLNQFYWVGATAIGGLLGGLISFNTAGLDFALTALFAAIFVKQWKEGGRRPAALIGVFGSICCLYIFGPERFILPAMLLIIVVLTVFRRRLDDGGEDIC